MLGRQIAHVFGLINQSSDNIKIRVEDVEAYEASMPHSLLRNAFVHSVVSSFSLRDIKNSTEQLI